MSSVNFPICVWKKRIIVRLFADFLDTLVCRVVQVVVETPRCERLEPQHPIIFPLFEEPPILFGCFALFDLLDERECGVLIEVVSG